VRSCFVAALAAVAVLAGCGGGGSESAFPKDPSRLVTEDQLSTDVMIALGFRPAAAVGMTAQSWAPALAPYLGSARNLGEAAGGSANLDAVTGVDPDGIVAPASLRRSGWSKNLERVAPTLLYPSADGWRDALDSVAATLGLGERARALSARLALRAAAIRGLVGGRTIAVLRIVSSQSFSTVNDAMPVAAVLGHDLGLRNAHLRPQQYPYGCEASPATSKPCATNSLFAPILGMMSPADALLVESEPGGAPAASSFENSPPFRSLPAARAGRVARATTFEELGPVGVGFLYAAVAGAFGLRELHVQGDRVALAYEPSARRLCAAGARQQLTFGEGGGTLVPSPRGSCTRLAPGALAGARLDGRRVTILPGPLG
jgi:ABC-type Fe3+-hydroxamate transport system substrate-binding protein